MSAILEWFRTRFRVTNRGEAVDLGKFLLKCALALGALYLAGSCTRCTLEETGIYKPGLSSRAMKKTVADHLKDSAVIDAYLKRNPKACPTKDGLTIVSELDFYNAKQRKRRFKDGRYSFTVFAQCHTGRQVDHPLLRAIGQQKAVVDGDRTTLDLKFKAASQGSDNFWDFYRNADRALAKHLSKDQRSRLVAPESCGADLAHHLSRIFGAAGEHDIFARLESVADLLTRPSPRRRGRLGGVHALHITASNWHGLPSAMLNRGKKFRVCFLVAHADDFGKLSKLGQDLYRVDLIDKAFEVGRVARFESGTVSPHLVSHAILHPGELLVLTLPGVLILIALGLAVLVFLRVLAAILAPIVRSYRRDNDKKERTEFNQSIVSALESRPTADDLKGLQRDLRDEIYELRKVISAARTTESQAMEPS